MVGSDVETRLGRQHREGFPSSGVVPEQACNAEQPTARLCEQPPALALLLRIGGSGELVEALGKDQAAPARGPAAVGAGNIDPPSPPPRPAPAAGDESGRIIP